MCLPSVNITTATINEERGSNIDQTPDDDSLPSLSVPDLIVLRQSEPQHNNQNIIQRRDEPLTIQPHLPQSRASKPRLLAEISNAPSSDINQLALGITQGSSTAPASYILLNQANPSPRTASTPAPHSLTN